MGIEENKAMVLFIMENYEQEDLRIAKYFAEELYWEGHQIDYQVNPWVPEVKPPVPKETWIETQKGYTTLFKGKGGSGNPVDREFVSITAEGDRVVAEYITRANQSDDLGQTLELRVVKVFEFADGLLVRMREYCDTGHMRVNAVRMGARLREIEHDSGMQVTDR